MNKLSETVQSAPAHVPKDAVRPYPFRRGRFSELRPHDIVADVQKNWPDAFYVKDLIPGAAGWVFKRAKDIQEIMFDTEHFSTREMAPYAPLTGGTWRLIPLEVDPPEHSFYRAAMNPLFTPSKMAALEGEIRKLAQELISSFAAAGQCDFTRQFAKEFPVRVFLTLMGLPLELAPQFLRWEHGLINAGTLEEISASTRAVVDYLSGLIEERRRAPQADFISAGIAAEVRGRKLTAEDLLGYCFNLYTGGLDTVVSHMGHHFRHLAEHPEDQARLRANPGLIPDAVDELMRAYASVTVTRRCIKTRVLGGVTVEAGDRVAIALPLAGRDPDAFENPNTVILDRRPRILSFGGGTHHCIGIHLAKRELRIAIEEFLKIIPAFKIAPGAVIKADIGQVLQLVNLPLIWTPGAAA